MAWVLTRMNRHMKMEYFERVQSCDGDRCEWSRGLWYRYTANIKEARRFPSRLEAKQYSEKWLPQFPGGLFWPHKVDS